MARKLGNCPLPSKLPHNLTLVSSSAEWMNAKRYSLIHFVKAYCDAEKVLARSSFETHKKSLTLISSNRKACDLWVTVTSCAETLCGMGSGDVCLFTFWIRPIKSCLEASCFPNIRNYACRWHRPSCIAREKKRVVSSDLKSIKVVTNFSPSPREFWLEPFTRMAPWRGIESAMEVRKWNHFIPFPHLIYYRTIRNRRRWNCVEKGLDAKVWQFLLFTRGRKQTNEHYNQPAYWSRRSTEIDR